MVVSDAEHKRLSEDVLTTKSKTEENEETQENSHCLAKADVVCLNQHSELTFVSGVRKACGPRVDSGLYAEFKPVAERLFGSVCHALESYMVSLVLISKSPGCVVNSLGKPIHIDKIVIERRSPKERRSLIFERERFDSESRLYCALNDSWLDFSGALPLCCDSSCPNKKCLDFVRHRS